MPLAKDMLFNQLKKPETTQDFHVINVYKDPEFIKDVKSQFPKLGAYIDIENIYKMPDGTMDHRTKTKVFYGIEKLDDKQFYELALKYAIHVNDIKIFLMGRHHTGKVYGVRRSYTLTPHIGGDWIANIPTDISKDEFMDIWKIVNRNKRLIYQKKVPKKKPPIHDKLLYAIFKQRQLTPPTSFPKIHAMYMSDRLPYYIHEKDDDDRIYDAKKLEEYYRKFSPRNLPPI
jgi:hypothetical protein